MKKWAVIFVFLMGQSLAVAAQEVDGVWVQYSFKLGDPTVEGAHLIARIVNKQVVRQSYPMKKIVRFIREDCADGKIGKIQLGKQKTKRRRGKKFVYQEFQTVCKNGVKSDYRGTTGSTTVYVEKEGDGRDKANYFFARSGDLIDFDVYR